MSSSHNSFEATRSSAVFRRPSFPEFISPDTMDHKESISSEDADNQPEVMDIGGPQQTDLFSPDKARAEQPISLFPLICVYGDTLQPTTLMPPEGICDLLFYDSFFKGGQNKIGPRAVPTASLSIFFKLSQSGTYTSTQMGIGFSQ
ncbi:hypothetical protein V5799_004891 [Amblyomma americanum]|uniref:Uncharacterized protein n=1 Tax=Amblyomma americanum TaxID=6943 RepID=A0AAQ4D4T4_AMBAM